MFTGLDNDIYLVGVLFLGLSLATEIFLVLNIEPLLTEFVEFDFSGEVPPHFRHHFRFDWKLVRVPHPLPLYFLMAVVQLEGSLKTILTVLFSQTNKNLNSLSYLKISLCAKNLLHNS